MYSKKTNRAIAKYTESACVKAFHMNNSIGEGAHSISLIGPVTIKTTRQADAAINAGREILVKSGRCIETLSHIVDRFDVEGAYGIDVDGKTPFNHNLIR